MRESLSTIAMIMVLASCSDPVGVQRIAMLTTDRGAYAPGAELRAQLTNESSGMLYYGVCLELQRRVGLWWVAGPVPQVNCPDIQIGLAAGDSALLGTTLPTETEPGIYRLRLSVRDSRGELLPEGHRISNTFTATQ